MLVMDLFDRGKVRKRSQEQRERKSRIWKLKDSVAEYQDRVRDKMTNAGTKDLWKTLKGVLVEEAAEVCGRTSGKGRQEKETWWWSDEVQNEGDEVRHVFDVNVSEEVGKYCYGYEKLIHKPP